jgi:hypothetical protein
MTQTQELDRTINAVCKECGAERPQQAHDPLCVHADTDTIVSTGESGETAEPEGEPTIKPEEPFVGEASNPNAQNPDAGWILKITPEHHCILPTIDDRTFVGSIWRCGHCGQDYLVYQKRGKQAGTKAFKKITSEKAASLLASKGRD